MDIDLSNSNGPDTITVSGNSPLFDLLDHIMRAGQSPATVLETLAEYRNHIDQAVGDAVDAARRDGVTWERVGAFLDMTRQGAQQKYGQQPE